MLEQYLYNIPFCASKSGGDYTKYDFGIRSVYYACIVI